MENPSFVKKKPFTKTLFASDFVLAMDVSKRVLERHFHVLFKTGPQICIYNWKIRANYAQMYLKIHNFQLQPSLEAI